MRQSLALAIIAAACAAAAPLAAEDPVVETYSLPNGLTVILQDRKSVV